MRVAWERFGSGEPALLFLGVDPIVESRMWKGQVPWFARRHTVVTFDPPGNGRSSRTTDPAAYTRRRVRRPRHRRARRRRRRAGRRPSGCARAPGSPSFWRREHPDRVGGVVAINPGMPLSPLHAFRRRAVCRGSTTSSTIRRGLVQGEPPLLAARLAWVLRDFFFDQLLPEPHSTKQHEDCVGWGLEHDARDHARLRCDRRARATTRRPAELCRQVRSPVLVICGDQDRCQPPERGHRIAELTGGELVVFEGSGHLTHARDPVRVNLEIDRFLRRVRPARVPRDYSRSMIVTLA